MFRKTKPFTVLLWTLLILAAAVMVDGGRAATSVNARSVGDPNQLIFGAQKGPLMQNPLGAYGDVVFTLGSAAGQPTYDVTVDLSPCYEPAAMFSPGPLQLLLPPRHIAARDGSFTAPGNSGWYYRWHLNSVPGGSKTAALKLRFNVPYVGSPYGGVPMPYLCVRATLWNDTTGFEGPEILVRWLPSGNKGGLPGK